MAILSDKTIKEYLEEGKITIDPILDEKQIQPSSVDMRLGDEFKVFKVIRKPFIDPKDEEDLASYMESTTVPEGEAFIIHPNEFALATTLEYVKLPDDIVATGFEGRITLEISNIGAMPVALYPGQRVCQIVFETMTTPSELPYGHPDRNSKYMGQTSPESSRVKLDYELKRD